MKKISILFILFIALSSLSFAKVQGDFYEFTLPAGFTEIDKENQLIVKSFVSEDSKIRIFNQHLDKHSYQGYINYGNQQLFLGKGNFQVIKKEAEKIHYKRPMLKNIENDQNFYIEAHVLDKARNRVVTIWGKTQEGKEKELEKNIDDILESLDFTDKGLRLSYKNNFHGEMKGIKVNGEGTTLLINKNETLWGRFFPGYPFYKDSLDKMAESEKKINHKFEFIMTYKTFPEENPFPIESLKKVYDEDRVVMLTLQPFSKDLQWIAVPEFIEGKHDEKIIELAEKLKELNEPIFIRPLNEMNGDWDPWCAWFYGKDTDLYIKAWQHIVTLMKEHGGNKLQFVWNPHDRSYPDFKWNNKHLYYPGDDYVDWIGLTGYNNGTSHPGDVWREFDSIYKPIYVDYLKRYSSKPFMITEFSSNEVGGDKAEWIKNGFKTLAEKYPNIKIAVWFDSQDGLWEYQSDSSLESFNAFKEGIKNPRFARNAVIKKFD